MTAIIAACGTIAVQLAFAAVAIGVVGMAHGASDLAIVAPARRPAFLIAYGAVCLVCLAWWVTAPALALPAFLAASAIHFGLEDAPDGGVTERVARGTALVAAPATLHVAALSDLLRLAGVPAALLPSMVDLLAVAGGVAAGGLVMLAIRRRDFRLLCGTIALLVLPPLVGFSVGFLILHALPQTRARRQQIGCASDLAYLRAVWPVLAAAILIVAVVGALLLRLDPSGVRALFAGIAALAMPHLLVTPRFEPRGAAVRQAVPSYAMPHS